jgi:hypothetical protein
MSNEQILDIRSLGFATYNEIKQKLDAFLTKGSGSIDVQEVDNSRIIITPAQVSLSDRRTVKIGSSSRPRATPGETGKSSAASTPLAALRLAARPYNCLMRVGIATVQELIGLSDEELLAIKNLGRGSLSDIRESLRNYSESHQLEGIAGDRAISCTRAAMSLSEDTIARPAESTGSSPRQVGAEPEPVLSQARVATDLPDPTPDIALADPKAFQAARELGIPLGRISVTRLGLARSTTGMLLQLGIFAVHDLATCSSARSPRWLWELKDQLDRYLAWLLSQNALAWEGETADRGISPLFLEDLRSTPLDTLIESWLSGLRDRDRMVMRWRYGLYGEILTLGTVSQRLKLTRERVRQIQKKSLLLLSHPSRRKGIAPLLVFLSDFVEQAGGLVTEDQLNLHLQSTLVVGRLSPAGVARLVLSLDSEFGFSQDGRLCWLDQGKKDRAATSALTPGANSQIGARPAAGAVSSLPALLGVWLSQLSSRAAAVIKSYYGIGQEARRISDTAAHLGIAPAYAVQTAQRAIRKLSTLGPSSPLQRCAEGLSDAVRSSGGILPIEQAGRELELLSPLGDHPATVWCRLIADADARISWSPALSAIVSSDFDDGLVQEVQNGFWSLVSQNGGEMLWDDAIFLFRNAPFIQEKLGTLSDSAVIACVRADPRLSLEGESVRIQGAGRGQIPDGADLGSVGRETVAATIAAVLAENGSRLAVGEIISRVTARRSASVAAIRGILANDRQFVRVARGIYALSDSVKRLV